MSSAHAHVESGDHAGKPDVPGGGAGPAVNDPARLDLQHTVLKTHMGSLYLAPAAVRSALEAHEGQPVPAVLDLGSGSGSWAIELANEFPKASVLGIDIAPVHPILDVPPNCRFEIADINEVVKTYNKSFNLIHSRLVCSVVQDYRALLREAQAALRPGGVLLLIEGPAQIYGADKQPVTGDDENDPNFSWVQKVMGIAWDHWNETPGSDFRKAISGNLSQLLNELSGWDNRGSAGGYIPVGPWSPDLSESEREAAELCRQNWIRMTNAVRPLLISAGNEPDQVDLWITNAVDELKNLKKHLNVEWKAAWATLPADA